MTTQGGADPPVSATQTSGRPPHRRPRTTARRCVARWLRRLRPRGGIGGLIGGIKSEIGNVGHAVGSVVSTIKSFLPFSAAEQGSLSGSGDPYYSGLSIGKIAAGITASLPAIKAAVSGTASQISSALSTAATEEASGTSQISKLTAQTDQLQALRAKEETSIKQLIAEREAESKADGAASSAIRAQQEDEIKELEKLRASQETRAKQTDAVIETVRKSMTQLKDEVDKLRDALKKATAASSNSSSSSSSADSSSSSSDQPANFAALGQWLAETAPDAGNPGSWQGNPGPLGGFGLAFDPGGGPRPVGGFDGGVPSGQGGGDLTAMLLADRLDTLIAAVRAQPARNAAGMAAAMNGVTGTAITRGNW